jgi:chromosomal replication initiator protein
MFQVEEIWKAILQTLPVYISSAAIDLWFSKLTAVEISSNILFLEAGDEKTRLLIETRFADKFKQTIAKSFPFLEGYEISCSKLKKNSESSPSDSEEKEEFSEETTVSTEFEEQRKLSSSQSLKKKKTFDNLLRLPSNMLAYTAALSVSKNPGGVYDEIKSFNPLFVYSGVGLGKTHLLFAIENYINAAFPQKKTLYVPAEQILTDYVSSLGYDGKKNGKPSEFRRKYRECDALFIDDIQFIEKKEGFQEILFYIFNELVQNNKQIVFTSDRSPDEIKNIEERIRSRLKSSLVTEISMPTAEDREALLNLKISERKIGVDREVIRYIAEHCPTNVRELEGILTRIVHYAEVYGLPSPTIESTKEAISQDNAFSEEKTDKNKIMNVVSKYYKITVEDLIGRKRTATIAEARKIAIYLIYKILSFPHATIANFFDGRDPSSIGDCVREIDKYYDKYQSKIEDIKEMGKIKG